MMSALKQDSASGDSMQMSKLKEMYERKYEEGMKDLNEEIRFLKDENS